MESLSLSLFRPHKGTFYGNQLFDRKNTPQGQNATKKKKLNIASSDHHVYSNTLSDYFS